MDERLIVASIFAKDELILVCPVAHADEGYRGGRKGHPACLPDELDVSLSVCRQLRPVRSLADILLPARQRGVDWLDASQIVGIIGSDFQLLVAESVRPADFDFLQAIEEIQLGHGYCRGCIEHD